MACRPHYSDEACEGCADPDTLPVDDAEGDEEQTVEVPFELAADLLPQGLDGNLDRSHEVWFDDDEATAVMEVLS